MKKRKICSKEFKKVYDHNRKIRIRGSYHGNTNKDTSRNACHNGSRFSCGDEGSGGKRNGP